MDMDDGLSVPVVVAHAPCGDVVAVYSRHGLRELTLGTGPWGGASATEGQARGDSRVEVLREALERYFRGEREAFADIVLDLEGYTPFRRSVWEAARQVPWGCVSTYSGLSVALGRGRNAARAVGLALGANPVPILVPCHRILTAQGTLGGFSGGLHWKRALLALEGHGAIAA